MGGENRREIVPRALSSLPPAPSSIKVPLRGEESVQTQRLWRLMNLCIAIGCEHAPGEGGVEQDGARWQPVTQSARSRQSYGKIGDCEQPRVKFRLWRRLKSGTRLT